ncbi:GNAT family N-acetyltransferase [Marinobacter daepoensis]|uniref:GNAT family N-acetyltransferase n=1 Tax=Marinobacter daepoensis TaxID=262077 RepID=UPI001C98E031|nr:GNAT family N-acetyltransferase [Marinobacter daepoensis]MBY6031546.1 GNAT family N-acetyltransferase [Marinobacter daepoensis]
MACEIRVAQGEDSGDISRVIIAALRSTNSQDYSPAIIERVEKSFSPVAVSDLISRRQVYVALINGEIVGTASLDGCVVRTVFVSPSNQRQGVGRKLMEAVERAARDEGMNVLSVPSSVTAEAFYTELGYISVSDSYHGDERTIIMERKLV